MFAHGSASLELFPVVWIFLRSLGVICYSRWVLNEGHKKLLQRLVSHEFTAYLSIFNQFKLNELWQYQKHVNQIILNRTTLYSLALQIFEAFIWISLIVNLSLNQTLLTFLLCARQISRKLCRYLIMFLTGFTSLSVLLFWLFFPLSITFFIFVHRFWFYFI